MSGAADVVMRLDRITKRFGALVANDGISLTLHRGEVVGCALRSKRRCNPLIVSPGHRVSRETAVELVLRCLAGYRLPEPTRLADRLASRRDRQA